MSSPGSIRLYCCRCGDERFLSYGWAGSRLILAFLAQTWGIPCISKGFVDMLSVIGLPNLPQCGRVNFLAKYLPAAGRLQSSSPHSILWSCASYSFTIICVALQACTCCHADGLLQLSFQNDLGVANLICCHKLVTEPYLSKLSLRTIRHGAPS